MIAKKIGMTEPAEERLSFMVQLTALLDKIIFEDKTALITDITIGGEGGYRMNVTDTQNDLDSILAELFATPGKTPWGISKSYKVNGLTVHTFIDMRFNVERYSTVF